MKTNIKKTFRTAMRNVYAVYIVRREKLRATLMWRRGIRAATKTARRLNGPRVYLWFDKNTMDFVPMVLEHRPKLDAVCMKDLQYARKIKAKRLMRAEDMKRESFFYTSSRWGAPGLDTGKMKAKYAEWIAYYMTELSEPMRKLRSFRP